MEFLWGEVLTGRLMRRSSFYETAEWGRARSFVRTAIRALWPRSFWRWVRLEDRPAIGRMAAVVIAALATIELLLGAARALLLTLPASGYALYTPYSAPSTTRWGLPLQVWLPTVLFPFGELNKKPVAGGGWGTWTPVTPFGALSLLTIALMPLMFLALPQTLRRSRVRPVHLVRVWAYGLVAVPLVIALADVGLVAADIAWALALPRSISPYSLFGTPALTDLNWWARLLAVCLWLFILWLAAARDYLRLAHARGVAAAMLVLSLLTSLLVIVGTGNGTWFLFGLYRVWL